MKVAALDLGSNTFLCLIAEVENDQVAKVYSDQVEMVRLGQGLKESQHFHPEALIRADRALKKFSDQIALEKPEKVLAMATAASREAQNKEELFKICQKYNIPVEIIPGDQEASITYRGALSGLVQDELNLEQTNTESSNTQYSKSKSTEVVQLVLDIGGGSTEFILGCGAKINYAKSLGLGCVKLTEQFITAQPTPLKEVSNLKNYVKEKLAFNLSDLEKNHVKKIFAVAGTPTTLAAVEIGFFDEQKINQMTFTKSRLEEWINKLASLSESEKLQMGFPAGRADVILSGVIILREVLEFFNLDELYISTRGVRYGVALEIYKRCKNDEKI